MLAVRQRAACAARRARLTPSTTLQAVRSYASDHHDHHHDDHHHAPQVEESLGLPFYIALGTIGFSIGLYSITRPGEDGELSAASKWLDRFRSENAQSWEERNTVRTNILNQAAVDRHTFGTLEKPKTFELRMPELFHSGSPRNVPAGHYVNIDHVVEHYRKEHLEEEERKLKKLSEANKE